MEGGKQSLLSRQPADVGRITEDAQHSTGIERENLRLAARVDERVRPDAKFSENVGRKLPRRRSSQLTVRGASGRSSENAGI